jgi:SAM-dependent methyltransferase
MLTDRQDAFGHEINDYYINKSGFEIVERNDGFFTAGIGPSLYFLEYHEWLESEKEAIKYAKGSVLDIGCGAGRHSLYLQEQGLDVLGVDVSPLALEVCRKRGLKKTRTLSITQIDRKLGIFDTILMLGNNFCLVGNVKRARWLLNKFHRMTRDSALIIAQTRDPYPTTVQEHLAYHALNRKAGKMSGETRIRVRYNKHVTPWIDFLMVSKDEMKGLLEGTRWEVKKLLEDGHSLYIAILGKRGQ